MDDHEFESGPFEMEEEARWQRSGRMSGRKARPHTPPIRPRPPGSRRIRPRYWGPMHQQDGRSRCDAAVVLDRYRQSNPGLERHHEQLLQRLAERLENPGGEALTVEVVSVQPSQRSAHRGDLGDRRTRAVVERLKSFLKDPGAPITFRRLARRAEGPGRIEIRVCTE
jgi:hypothetical protein